MSNSVLKQAFQIFSCHVTSSDLPTDVVFIFSVKIRSVFHDYTFDQYVSICVIIRP